MFFTVFSHIPRSPPLPPSAAYKLIAKQQLRCICVSCFKIVNVNRAIPHFIANTDIQCLLSISDTVFNTQPILQNCNWIIFIIFEINITPSNIKTIQQCNPFPMTVYKCFFFHYNINCQRSGTKSFTTWKNVRKPPHTIQEHKITQPFEPLW